MTDVQFLKFQQCLINAINDINLDTSSLEELVQQLIDEKDFELKSIPLAKYCCNDGSTYSVLNCKKFEDNVETGSELIIYQTSPDIKLLTELPECAELCGLFDYEFKYFEKERCLPNGTKVLEVVCIKYINGNEDSQSTYWIVNGQKVNIEPAGITDCVTPCYEYIGDFDGDNLPKELITGFQLIRDKCTVKCKLLLITSIGEVTIYPGEMIFTKGFKCPTQIKELKIIEGNCKLKDIKGRWTYASCIQDRI